MKSVGIIPGAERIPLLDILRGLALFGILLYNIEGFAYPLLYHAQLGTNGFSSEWEQWGNRVLLFFVQGKFYTMFSFLFGYSFILWLQKMEQKQLKPIRLAVRRMLALLIFGILHAVFFWWGDILVNYALCGLLLILFRNVQAKSLFRVAIGLLIAYAGLISGLLALTILVQKIDPNLMEQQVQIMQEQASAAIEQSHLAYGTGGWSELFSQRFADLLLMAESLPLTMMSVLAMFLLGASAAKGEWLPKLQQMKRGKLTLFVSCLTLLGIVVTLIKSWSSILMDPLSGSGAAIVNSWASAFGDPILSLAYMGIVMLICLRPQRVQKLLWLGNMGKLSLSNYLIQSLLCSTLFYFYGAALYGKVSFVGLLGLSLAFYVGLAYLSHWWINRFGIGPAERLIRWMTYGKRRE